MFTKVLVVLTRLLVVLRAGVGSTLEDSGVVVLELLSVVDVVLEVVDDVLSVVLEGSVEDDDSEELDESSFSAAKSAYAKL